MPIYEFYCSDCHTLFNFFAAAVDTETRPPCPRCSKPRLERRPARFAMHKHRGEEEPEPFADLDDERLANFMSSMMEEVGSLGDDEDPRMIAGMFRRFSESTGLQLGPRMEEMMTRMEAGEDLEELEEELEGEIEGDDSLEEFFRFRKRSRYAIRHPRIDDTLYFL
jgi:putative FmdB family regulatory protein